MVIQPVRCTSQGVVAVNHVSRALYVLSPGDPLTGFFRRSRTHIVIKRENLCSRCFTHQRCTLGVIACYHRIVVEEIWWL